MITWKIITGPIDSGKTTFAEANIRKRNSVEGVICPKRNGVRFLRLIGDNKFYNLDAVVNTNAAHDDNKIRVGRYTFDRGVFLLAKAHLSNLIYKEFDILVIDEIGKLELADDGYEPELSTLFSYLVLEPKVYEVVIIVRDYLLQDFLGKYEVTEYELLK